MKRTKIWETS